MFEFGNVLMQASSTADLTALIVAIATAIGTIGALVAAISAKIKASTHDDRISKIAGDAESIGQLATAFAQKTAEQSGELQTIAEVVTNLSPEAKAALEANYKDLQYWKERATVANAQLGRLLPIVDGKAQASSIVNLPREKKAVV
jgi:hypothetical protein